MLMLDSVTFDSDSDQQIDGDSDQQINLPMHDSKPPVNSETC